MRFILKGKEYNLSNDDFLKQWKKEEPEPIREHYVEIESVGYPVKQVIAKMLNIPKISFTTMNTYQIN